MTLDPSGNSPVHFVDQPDKLRQSLQELERHDTLSFDIEFDNNSYGYGVTLCLIQVATPKECYVIDGLVGLDLSPLYALFESERYQKILHAPGEDLRLLHSLQCYPQNLFDTEVVARLLNYEQTSLSVLLRDKLNVGMDKKQQRSNWLRRPLTAAQIQYAADDVLWLHPLKAVLEAEAAERELMPFVKEEQALLSTTIYPAVTKTNFLKPSDLYTLSPREQYITNELLRYRDELARSINRPPYRVMGEELIRGLAAGSRPPESIMQEPEVHPRFKNSRFVTEFRKQLAQIRHAAEAQNLATERQRPSKWLPPRNGGAQNAAIDKEKIFAPIKGALEQRFGIHAATLMFSNKLVNSLLNGTNSLKDIKPAYRQVLIREIAAAQGIDLGSYDNESGKD